MKAEEMDLHNAVTNLYRSVTGDQKSTPAEIALDFANEPLDESLAYHSQIGGKNTSQQWAYSAGIIKISAC